MARILFVRLIKTLMMTAPFLSLIMMLLALWGVGGKTIYTDLNFPKKQIEFSDGDAKNYLVNETKGNELCSKELKNPEVNGEEKNDTPKTESLPEKIDWDQVV